MSGPASSLPIPRQHTLAGYDVVAKLRTGGMAALYLGRKTGAGGFAKYVAIKVVLEHLAEDPMLVSMFLDEARVSARIEHPNVVHIHELGAEGDTHFLVMEYVAGASLAQLQRAAAKRGRRFAPAFVAHLGMQVAAGLHAAHEVTDDLGAPLHVVHRDVSPKNVLLAFKGYVKLIDFGIAKVRDATQATSAGALKGTLRYMSPEQAEGRASLDRRSDVFSLGIVLWELLTGRPLFRAETDLAALDLVRRAVVPPPSRFAPVPPALEQVVMRMLSGAAEQRYATAADAQRALAAAVPDVVGIGAEHVGELVVALCPPTADAGLDPGVASALGRPSPPRDAEALLAWLTAPLEGTAGEGPDATSGVSGAVPKAPQGPTPIGDPSVSGPGTELGPLSAVSAAAVTTVRERPAKGPARGLVVAGIVALAAVAGIAVWWSARGGGEIVATPLDDAPSADEGTTAAASAAPPVAAAPVADVAPAPSAPTIEVPSSAAPPTTDDARREARVEARAPGRRVTGRGDVGPADVAPSTATPPPSAGAEERAPTVRRRRDTHVSGDPVISTEF